MPHDARAIKYTVTYTTNYLGYTLYITSALIWHLQTCT